MSRTIELQKDSILQIPFDVYANDFSFIVNDNEYKTNKLFADILSPIISKQHKNDPTMNEYFINTKNEGDFSHFLKLINFNKIEISDDEVDYFYEIFDALGIEKVDVNIQKEEINLNNVISLMKKHEKTKSFHLKEKQHELDFLSSHFSEIRKEQNEELKNLSFETLLSVISNEKLRLENEDELLDFINELYETDPEYSALYEFVQFVNVDGERLKKFIDIFSIEYLTVGTWNSISNRLIQMIDLDKVKSCVSEERYNGKGSKQNYYCLARYSNDQLGGIFSYLRKNSSIQNEVNVTFSSCEGGDVNRLLQIENTDNDFYTANKPNSWICFEFKKHQIIPSNYSIRSFKFDTNGQHPKSWVIEGSNDNKNWKTIDQQTDNSSLNGFSIVQTFPIQELKETDSFKFIRMKLTGANWYNNNNKNHRIEICSIELYGKLI